ncbi:MAG: serine/threonine protein kinase [Myxococcales bacterium]|nr:serine/threonine protein kinase [Myxococcales bacterium]
MTSRALRPSSSPGPLARVANAGAAAAEPKVEELPSTVVQPGNARPRGDDGPEASGSCDRLAVVSEEVLFQGDFVGRYSVLSQLGRGGMGVVYKAYDPQLDRNIALKVLRPDKPIDPSANEIRLIREAQALAKLRHPNIVTVYDAGLSPQGVFVAMELIEGQTLGAWLDQTPRRVEDVLERFKMAGLGLAAAHQAGIVHRDFKPANVLLSNDGTVRVLDFGLAQLADPRPSTDTRMTEDLPMTSTGGGLPDSGSSPTITGMLMGTPAYMSPEQLARGKADERSDQYTFCLCLHLALGGEPPDRGIALDAVVARIANPPRRRAVGSVPARVRRALERGLSIDPAARFESMEALLSELAEPPRRWKTMVASSMLMVGFSLGAMVFARDDVDPCVAPSLRGVWGDTERQAVRRAMLGSGHEHAQELLLRVEVQLDDYTSAMAQMHARSCQATHETHEQSAQLFDQQVLCLERRRSGVRAAVTMLAQARGPRQVLDRMVLPFTLPVLDECADPGSLASQQPLPEDPERRDRIAALRQRIDVARAQADGGDARGAVARGRVTVDEARTLGYPPVLAEALEALGAMEASGVSAREAEATLTEAIEVAAAAEADVTAARAWTWLLYALMAQGRVEQGLTLQLAAEAAVERAKDRIAKGWLLNNLGALYGKADRAEQSIDFLERALVIKRETLGEDHVDVGISWFNLGTALSQLERYDDAQAAYDRAREIFDGTVGAAHPLTHHTLAGLCAVEFRRRNFQTAITLCDEVLEHLEASPWSATSMGELRYIAAQAQWGAGQWERARQTAQQAHAQVLAENPKQAARIAAWLDLHPLPPPTRDEEGCEDHGDHGDHECEGGPAIPEALGPR